MLLQTENKTAMMKLLEHSNETHNLGMSDPYKIDCNVVISTRLTGMEKTMRNNSELYFYSSFSMTITTALYRARRDVITN